MGVAKIVEASQIYDSLSIPQKGEVGDIIQYPYHELCVRTSTYQPPFEYLRDRLHAVDTRIREIIELSRSGDAVAQKWLKQHLAEETGENPDGIEYVTHAEALWLLKATSKPVPLQPRFKTQNETPWSPTAIAREEFLSRFMKCGFIRKGRDISCSREWGLLHLKSAYGSLRRVLYLFYEIERFQIPFFLGKPFMFSSGDLSAQSEIEFRRILCAQLDESSILFPHVAKAIDDGVVAGFAALKNHHHA